MATATTGDLSDDAMPTPSQGTRGNRGCCSGRAMKQGMKMFCKSISSMMRGTFVTDDDVAAVSPRGSIVPAFDGTLPEQPPKRSQPSSQHSLADFIRREQLRRGRPFTADEHESAVNNWKIRQTLVGFGLEQIGSDESFYERRMRERAHH
eukprot:CAMPEP_0172729068 /NCGR_PEP_ID=MMETSP1074-20121228/93621_1 /TAXON_ID=2916 /ORGANISM="Ceratium fusus, Strain PA161109" /LENGTH=149 /DNA_ID=CAMNT_0013556451 /DNA_START=23 /DNA_END=472 /DNA_ORIENTATION=-